jgi:hypothetical protein
LTSKCTSTHRPAKNLTVSCLNFITHFLEWVMRQVLPVEERLKNYPFPESITGTAMENPVEVSIKIPDYVYVGDDIQSLKIAVWSAEKQEW